MSGSALAGGVKETSEQKSPITSAPASLLLSTSSTAASGSSVASTESGKPWTITAADEIPVVASDDFPHLYPLNPKHTWPITEERMRVIQRDASDGNPSALCVLGTAYTLCRSRIDAVR